MCVVSQVLVPWVIVLAKYLKLLKITCFVIFLGTQIANEKLYL